MKYVRQIDDGLLHILSGDPAAHESKNQGEDGESVPNQGEQSSGTLTPLIHFACGNGHLEVLRLLIQVRFLCIAVLSGMELQIRALHLFGI